jgi:hypothetical protein
LILRSISLATIVILFSLASVIVSGAEEIDELVLDLASENTTLQSEAAMALGESQDPQAIDH